MKMFRKKLWPFVTALLMVVIILCVAGGPALAQPARVRVLIGFQEKLLTNRQQEIDISNVEGRFNSRFKHIPGVVIAEIPPQALPFLRMMRGVQFAEIDGLVEAIDQDVPWGVERINAPGVFPISRGEGVKVGIIDTGIDYTHPDLAANYAGGYDFYYGDSDPMDGHSHGTHVAGTVGAVDNDEGVVGVAPEARLYGIKVLSDSGSGYWSDVVAGINWAIDNNMDVINMSLGSSSSSSALQAACNAAEAAGIVVVAAAGNSGSTSGIGTNTLYPANYSSVIAVAATDSTDTRAYFSSTGPAVELAAPGYSIPSTIPGTGTSSPT